nr:PilZ domain-containing protein [Sphingomonas sp.]
MRPLAVSKREPKRSRVFLAAQVDCGSGPVEARIRDISRSGALLESDVAQQPGAKVQLT